MICSIVIVTGCRRLLYMTGHIKDYMTGESIRYRGEFGISGLRLGYALSSNSEIVRRLRDTVSIWNINSLAEHFLEAMPRFEKDYRESCDLIRHDRDELRAYRLSKEGGQ